jgi:plastocyanin
MRATLLVAALLSGLCANVSVAAQSRTRAQPIDVILTDFAFTPQRLHLHQGQAYMLRFVNRGSGGHNFSSPAFFAAARMDPADAGAVAGGKVELGGNQSRTLRLVPAAGSYAVTCTHFLHAGFGMVGSITVD